MKKFSLIPIVGFLLIYIVPLGVRPVVLPDEFRYAQISREMIASGDWIVPHLNGLRYFEKPVMGYWLEGASIKTFGKTGFAIRFPSAVGVGISALMIFLLIRRFAGGHAVGILAAMTFLTFLQVYAIGTFNVLDSMLTMFLTVAMTSFFFAHNSVNKTWPKRGFLLLFGTFCGIAFLTKGFLAFVVPVVAIVPFMIWERRWKELFRIPLIPVGAAILVVMPWAILIHLKEPGFWHFFIWHEHINRFLSGVSQHGKPFWYFSLVFPAAALPCTFLFPAVLAGSRRFHLESPLIRYTICWLLFPFLFFSASKGKIITYILPCFPALAILVSVGLNAYFKTGGKRAFNAGALLWAVVALLLAITLVAVEVGGFDFKPYNQTWKWSMAASGLFVCFLFSLSAARGLGYQKKLALFFCAPLPFLFIAQFIMPDITAEHKAPGKFLMGEAKRIRPATILVADENPLPAVCWLYGRSDVYQLGAGGELMYGFQYDDAKHRLLSLGQFKELVGKNSGKGQVILVAKFRKYKAWRERLPRPLFEDNNGSGGYVFVQY